MNHLPIGSWQVLNAWDDNIASFHLDGPHFHKHLYSITLPLVVVQDALQLDPLAHYILHVPDSLLAAPVVVCGSGSAHYHLAMVGHAVQHRTQHVLTHVLVVDVAFLSAHHVDDGCLELFGPDLFAVIEFLVVDASLAAQLHGNLTFCISPGNTVNILVAQLGQVLADSESDSSSRRRNDDVDILLGLDELGPWINNLEGDDLPLDGAEGGESRGTVDTQELVGLLSHLCCLECTSRGSF